MTGAAALCCHLLPPSPTPGSIQGLVCLSGSPPVPPVFPSLLPLAQGEPRELLANPVPAPCPAQSLCAFRFPHPSALGFSSLTDKAEILINSSSMNDTTTFLFLRLPFLPQRLLVSGATTPTKSIFYSFKPLLFPVLSPSVSHTHHSPQPINSQIKAAALLWAQRKPSLREAQLLSPTEPHPCTQSCAAASPADDVLLSGSLPFLSTATVLWRLQLIAGEQHQKLEL